MSDRFEGVLVLPDGLARGMVVCGAMVESVDADAPVGEGPAYEALLRTVQASALPLIAPGFVDTHVHGGQGADTMDGPDGVRTLAAFHLEHGTTTLLPTTITSPWSEVLRALEGVVAARETAGRLERPLPDLPGAHLEGPFLSRKRLGAQPDATLAPEPARVRELLALDVVRVATIAPEIDGGLEAAQLLARAGVRVSLGHTDADYDTVRGAIDAILAEGGTVGFTHLFNAMRGFDHREPGPVGAALAEPAAFAELILDTHHVHPAAFRAAAAAKPGRLHLVTDAIRAAGLGDGPSELGGRRVAVTGGAARLADGTLAGSVLTLDRAFAYAVRAGLPLHRVAAMTSRTPSMYLGLTDRGEITPGRRADLVVMDGGYRVRTVVVAGRRVAGASA